MYRKSSVRSIITMNLVVDLRKKKYEVWRGMWYSRLYWLVILTCETNGCQSGCEMRSLEHSCSFMWCQCARNFQFRFLFVLLFPCLFHFFFLSFHISFFLSVFLSVCLSFCLSFVRSFVTLVLLFVRSFFSLFLSLFLSFVRSFSFSLPLSFVRSSYFPVQDPDKHYSVRSKLCMIKNSPQTRPKNPDNIEISLPLSKVLSASTFGSSSSICF